MTMKDKIVGLDRNNVLIDGLTTEFQATVLLIKAPFIALRTWSTEPLSKATKESEQLTKDFIARHS